MELLLGVATPSVPASTGATVILGPGAMACTQLNAFFRTPPSAEFKLITDLTRQPVLLAYRMKNSELELHTDYLLSSFGVTTATGLSGYGAGRCQP